MQDLDRFEQTGAFVARQVDLGAVTGDDAFRFVAQAGEEHEHLLGRCVLRLVEHDEGVIERPSAHVGQRRDLDDPAVHEFLDLVGLQHVIERIVKRTKIREDFFLQRAGEKSEGLAGFHCGAGQDDAADLFLLEGGDGHGHGQIGLAGSGRADAEDDIMLADGADVIALSGRLGNDRCFARGADDAFGGEFGDAAVRRAFLCGLQGVAKFLFADDCAPAAGFVELREDLGRACGFVFVSLDADPSLARGDLHTEPLFQFAEQALVVVVERGGRAGIVEMERGALHQAVISAGTRRPAPSRCGLRVRTGFRPQRSRCRSSEVLFPRRRSVRVATISIRRGCRRSRKH